MADPCVRELTPLVRTMMAVMGKAGAGAVVGIVVVASACSVPMKKKSNKIYLSTYPKYNITI